MVFCLFLPSRFHRAPNVLAISEVMVKDRVKDRVKGESRDADLGQSLRIELDVKTGRFSCVYSRAQSGIVGRSQLTIQLSSCEQLVKAVSPMRLGHANIRKGLYI